MKKITLWLLAVLITIILTNTASAGILDKLLYSEKKDNTAWSLDSIYSSIRSYSLIEDEKSFAMVQEVFITESGDHITPSNKIKSRTYQVSVSAYSSTVDQTDDSPFITASGTYVRDGIVAANFLPIGTAIKIPSLFGDKIFIVEDRMNRRYSSGYVDIWFPEREMAKQFGRKNVVIEVIS